MRLLTSLDDLFRGILSPPVKLSGAVPVAWSRRMGFRVLQVESLVVAEIESCPTAIVVIAESKSVM